MTVNSLYSAPPGPIDYTRAKSAILRQQWAAIENAFARVEAAMAAVGASYINIAAGLAATQPEQTFRVDDGLGTIRTYSHDIGGTATLLGSFDLGAQSASVFLYQRTTTNIAPALPSASTTYTFSTGALETANNGWTQELPSIGGEYLWITYATATSTTDVDTILSADWAPPALLAQDGESGKSNAVIFAYQRSATVPAGPSVTTVYTFSTKEITGLDNGWTQAIPAGTLPLYVVQATASSIGDTDGVLAAEWSNPVVLVANGVDGDDGLPGTPGADGVSLYTWYAYADSADGAINFTTNAPGTRVFQGFAANKTTPTESTNPADYVWGPYTGPPGFGLAAANGGEVAGSKIVRRSGASWDAQVYSTESFTGGAFVSFKPEVGNDAVMIGLNTDPTATNWTTLDYAIYIEAGTMYFAESGSIGTITTYNPATDTFAIHYDGANVRYSKNGTVLRTVAAAAGTRFFLDSAMSNAVGVKATITAWAAAGPTGPQGDDGPPGVDGADGADGAQGEPALGFVQDGHPGAGQFVSQTWYRPTSKEWYRWTAGGVWERILGDLSAQDLIANSAYIDFGVINTGHIIDLNVSTIKIAGNAVTVPTYSTSNSSTTLPSTNGVTTDLLSHVISPTVSNIYISITVDIGNLHASLHYINQFIVSVNGVVVFTSENITLANDGAPANTAAWPYSGFVNVYPGIPNTIKVSAVSVNAFSNPSVRSTNKTIFALEAKK